MAIRRRNIFYYQVRCDDPNRISCKNSTEKVFGRDAAIKNAKKVGFAQKGVAWRCPSCNQESLQKARKFAERILPGASAAA